MRGALDTVTAAKVTLFNIAFSKLQSLRTTRSGMVVKTSPPRSQFLKFDPVKSSFLLAAGATSNKNFAELLPSKSQFFNT